MYKRHGRLEGLFAADAARWIPACAGMTRNQTPQCASLRWLCGGGLMPEMSDAGEHHGNPMLIGAGDHFLVADGAAGLDNGSDTR
jgi:hypothetical protein